MGDTLSVTATIESAAYVLIDLKQTVHALHLLGVCEAMRQTLDAPIAPREQARMDKFIARAHFQISDDDFVRSWNEGHALTLDEVLKSVLDSA